MAYKEKLFTAGNVAINWSATACLSVCEEDNLLAVVWALHHHICLPERHFPIEFSVMGKISPPVEQTKQNGGVTGSMTMTDIKVGHTAALEEECLQSKQLEVKSKSSNEWSEESLKCDDRKVSSTLGCYH